MPQSNFSDIRMIDSFGISGKNVGLFGYGTKHTKVQVETPGYFNPNRRVLKVGDIIIVGGDIDGTPFVSTYLVSGTGENIALTEHSAVTQNVLQEMSFQKVSTKGSDAEVVRFVPSFAGSITKFYSVLNAALATGNATLTLAINGNAVTNGAITATQAGSAAGDVDVATPTAANTFEAGDVITVTAGGASTADATANLTLQLTPA